MTGDRGNFDDVEALLEQARDRLVPQIVQMQIIEAHTARQPLPGKPHRIRRRCEYRLALARLKASQGLYGTGGERHVTAGAVFSDGQVRNTLLEVDVLPPQGQQLASAHAGFDREDNQWAQVAHASLVSCGE